MPFSIPAGSGSLQGSQPNQVAHLACNSLCTRNQVCALQLMFIGHILLQYVQVQEKLNVLDNLQL